MATQAWWTLDELVGRVAAALAGSPYPGAPNGRVRDVPDRRAIRWYATIGLVDRPAATRGRTALYGPRHLLQLVAVKRRQAEGRSLAEIQAELTGATDARLRHLAGVPDELLRPGTDAEPGTDAAAPRTRFWAERPVAAEPAPDDDRDTVTTLTAVVLPGGATLVLPARPEPDDLDAIQAAARPLLDLLAGRGLLAGPLSDRPAHRRSAR
jgi:DNA-binding transcriptional MerR regulator